MHTPPALAVNKWAEMLKILIAAAMGKEEKVPGRFCPAGIRVRACLRDEGEQDTKALFTIHYK